MPLLSLVRKSMALFWCIDALLFFVHHPVPGAPSLGVTASIVTGLVALFIGLGCLSDNYWKLSRTAQIIWLVLEPIWLAAQDPYYLVHPLGLCSKNLPILLLLYATNTKDEERWARRAVAIVWVTEGLFPKMLFQQSMELGMAQWFFRGIIKPSASLYLIGAAQITSGVLSLLLPKHLARWVLMAQLVGLFVLPLLVLVYEPSYALFLCAPLWKNIPIIAATYWASPPLRHQANQLPLHGALGLVATVSTADREGEATGT